MARHYNAFIFKILHNKIIWLECELSTFSSNVVQCNVVDGERWFQGKDIASILLYTDTDKAITNHVFEENELKFKQWIGLAKTACLTYNEFYMIYINESGLYALTFGSKKKEANMFKTWVCSEVIPSIRKQ